MLLLDDGNMINKFSFFFFFFFMTRFLIHLLKEFEPPWRRQASKQEMNSPNQTKPNQTKTWFSRLSFNQKTTYEHKKTLFAVENLRKQILEED
jgi:hypothetical protein